ncbi:hypothetical protein [Kribbella sindirgiensis]|uniref:hypothetical protein n=1 Tax=Kribbella sindirgiensis TaxID=1124744 RepID=UPI0013F3EE27|nr:hypothetical protein [Kribbella sindirgiensis]
MIQRLVRTAISLSGAVVALVAIAPVTSTASADSGVGDTSDGVPIPVCRKCSNKGGF